MTAQLVAAFGKRIEALTWMAPVTKKRARERHGTLQIGVGYPDRLVHKSNTN